MKTKWTKHEIRNYLFSIDEDLKEVYYLKEHYREFNLTAEYESYDQEFDELIDEFKIVNMKNLEHLVNY